MINYIINGVFLLYFTIGLILLIESDPSPSNCHIVEYTIASMVLNTVVFIIINIEKENMSFIISIAGISITIWGMIELLNLNCGNYNDGLVLFDIPLCLLQFGIYTYLFGASLCTWCFTSDYEDL